MKSAKIEIMHCPRCRSRNFTDNGDAEPAPDPIRYRCSACAMLWQWSPTTKIMAYDNGNGGTTKVSVEIEDL